LWNNAKTDIPSDWCFLKNWNALLWRFFKSI
jgi:hypothetical protein